LSWGWRTSELLPDRNLPYHCEHQEPVRRRRTSLSNPAESQEIDVALVFEKQPSASKNLLVTAIFTERLYIIKLCADPHEIRTAYHPSELDPSLEIYHDASPAYRAWHANWWSSEAKPYVRVDGESLILDFLKT
jgi:hypothetical protein